MNIFRTIYIAGSRLRGTPVISCRDELLESQWWTKERFLEHQLKAVNSLISHARRYSPFYRRVFEECDLHREIGDLKELDRLPTFRKKDILENLQDIQNHGTGGKLIASRTSGTSGEALRFFRSGAWDTGHRAAVARGYSWYGVDPWTRSGLLWGIPYSRLERMKKRSGDIIQNRFRTRTFDFRPETLEDFYHKLRKASVLEGYSSMIHELALYVERYHADDDPLSLLLVKGTSEKIFPHYQLPVKKAFGRRLSSEYGAAESGIIAFECPEGRMHVNMEHVIVEEEDGEIVITNLLSHSFPFIRYRLDDYISFEAGAGCPCGRKSSVITEVSGRVGDLIYGRSGATFPSLVIYYIIDRVSSGNRGFRRLHAVQEKKGRLVFKVSVYSGQGVSDGQEIESAILEAARFYFSDEIDCSVEFESPVRAEDGKLQDFVSLV